MDLFIVKTSELYYGINKVQVHSNAQETLLEFIYNPNSLLLQGYLDDNKLTYSLQVKPDRNESIIFYKTSLKVLTESNAAHNVNVITLTNTPAESLYQILKQVYTPLLTEGNSLLDNKLQQNLIDLESNLRILTHTKIDSEKFQVILTIDDEIYFWKSMLQQKKVSKKDAETASAFSELFEELNEELRILQTSSLAEAKELIENVSGLLDDVWRHSLSSYPQERMKNIFDIIGYTVNSKIQSILNDLKIWKVYGDLRDNEVLTSLSASFKATQTWTSACESLTGTYWPNHVLHPWNGEPYVPTFCKSFKNRLKEISDIKFTHHQLNKLLTDGERVELKMDMLLEPFEDINVWSFGCNGLWENGITKLASNLRPSEAKIAEKLKPRLQNLSTKQMLYEFMKYKTLIQRPHVKESLSAELEVFLSSLRSLLKSIQKQLDVDDNKDVQMFQPPEMSPIIQQVQWAKQMEAKVKDIQECAEVYLPELDGSIEVIKMSNRLMKDLKNMYTQLHEEWSRDLQAQVKDGSLRLSLDKPVVEFSPNTQLMVVHFNPRLVSVEIEIRGMAALGLPPPPAVKEAVDDVAKFLHYARSLQQVASFHNSLGERVAAPTRPLLLDAALALAALVAECAPLWGRLPELARYSAQLQRAVMHLEAQNSYLTNQHVAIRKIVESLIETDLLAKQSEWKKKIKEMRDIIEKVEANGYKNTEVWRAHWDWQLYKALECQYIKTLLSLHKYFPHVKVDLVLRGREVKLQPPIEEIRVQHYHQIRRLVSLPTQFVGVQDPIKTTENIFSSIVDKHRWVGALSVRRVEKALAGASATREAWARRAALATVDLPAACARTLTRVPHWEDNFKACKAYGQAVAKMTFEDERVEWISIGTATLRHEFEAQARNLWGCLISSLQDSARHDAAILHEFCAGATLALNSTVLPSNARELSDISAKQQGLREKMPEMEKIVEDVKKKGHMLHTWGGDPSLDSTIKEWQKIHQLMISQQQVFEHQAEIVKTGLTGEWENLNSRLDGWSSRWIQNRTRIHDLHNVTLTDMCDRCEQVFEAQMQWENFLSEKTELLKECAKFNMSFTESETWKQTEALLEEDSKLWTIFKEYNEDFQSLADQEWIVFNKKLHLLDEFVSRWSPSLEPYTPITLFMRQEIDKFSDMTPLLKYLRGTDYTESHWGEVFSLLEMEYKKPEAIQVKDLLMVTRNIKTHVKALQKISSSAAGEAAARGALRELELWFAGARVALAAQRDRAGRVAVVGQHYGDLLTKLEQQQWLVGSLRGGAGLELWEGRLRRAARLVRDAHHAQRRVDLQL